LTRTTVPVAGAALLCALALAASLAPAANAQAADDAQARQGIAACPTFHVLHNDRVGKLKLPEGHYTITPFDPSKLSCEKAAKLFAEFLQDFDGNLPRNWRVRPRIKAFQRGHSQVGFYVKRGQPSGGGGGQHPAKGRACPNLFRVLHNDRIGRLKLPAGRYRITLLARRKPSCQRAAGLFAKFLEHPNGKLPSPWDLDPSTATFSKRKGVGFRVKRVGS
jgi:hypothetical protein